MQLRHLRIVVLIGVVAALGAGTAREAEAGSCFGCDIFGGSFCKIGQPYGYWNCNNVFINKDGVWSAGCRGITSGCPAVVAFAQPDGSADAKGDWGKWMALPGGEQVLRQCQDVIVARLVSAERAKELRAELRHLSL